MAVPPEDIRSQFLRGVESYSPSQGVMPPGASNMADLFQQAGQQNVRGLDMQRMGQLFSEMQRMGMMGGSLQLQQQHLLGMAGATSAMRDIYADMGRPMAQSRELLQAMQQMTAGQMHQLNPQQLEMAVRRTGAIQRLTGASYQDIVAMANQGAAMSQQHGLNPIFGLAAAQSSAAFGAAFGASGRNLGFGGLSRNQAVSLDQELRIAAAKSPLANTFAAAISMAEQGVIKGQLAQQLLDPAQRDQALNQIAQMGGPAGFMSFLQQMGVNRDIATQFMTARQSNQEVIARFNLQDSVRQFQGQELGNILRDKLAGTLIGTLRDAGVGGSGGVGRRERREAAQRLASIIQTELQRISDTNPEMMSDPAKAAERNRIIAARLQASGMLPPGADANSLVAGAVRSLDEQIRRDPNLSRFGNLAGALAISADNRANPNQNNLVNQGNQIMAEANQRADEDQRRGGAGERVQHIEAKLAEFNKLQEEQRRKDAIQGPLTREQQQQRAERQEKLRNLSEELRKSGALPGGVNPHGADMSNGAGAGNQATGAVTKITGTLTLRADGQADIEANGVGAAPGG